MTDPGRQVDLLEPLPAGVGELARVCQGLLIHEFLTGLYGVELSPEAQRVVQVRPIERRLELLHEADARPLTVPRDPDRRQSADCRHYSVLLVTFLRSRGIPARARCGFGWYFGSGHAEDHWVGEYWRADEGRWVLVDAQIDEVQRNLFHPDFDVLDVPRDRFQVAGDAWRACRSGDADPGVHGLTAINEFGLWWIAANLIRDAASLSGMEMLPWDVWGAMPGPDDTIPEPDLELFDHLAALTADPQADFTELRRLVADEPRLRVPPTVWNANLRQRDPVP
ncbi:MAG: transglutaminase domain-containing protein [Candidatus Dormibacteraeota bacterium]|nr:transglutaminase domain-containing protein [Candidatus Dormibacteraeota bacterium]MBO0746272.1 transglutaminase domain-containing protein [Candidatus Dormibacteraeota bacterium]